MSSFLTTSTSEPSLSASKTLKAKKKGKSRPRKAWTTKKNKRKSKNPFVPTHAAHVDSYPTVNLVDEFTDSVSVNDPVFHYDDNPSLQLGEFLLVSPNGNTSSDPLGSASSDKKDPLSTNSDCINLEPDDNPHSRQSTNLPSFFLIERRNEPSAKIPLNSDGDALVANMLRNAMIEICSNKLGEMELNRKNEWIIDWRKFRYPESDLLRAAMEKYDRNVLDYDYCDETPNSTFTTSVPSESYRTKSSTDELKLTLAKISNNAPHLGSNSERTAANNDKYSDSGETTDPSNSTHEIDDQTSRKSPSHSRTTTVDPPNCSLIDSSESIYDKTAVASLTDIERRGNITSNKESSQKGLQSQTSDMASTRKGSHSRESSYVERPAVVQAKSLLQKTTSASRTDKMHEPGNISPKSDTQESSIPKKRRSQSKKMSASENSDTQKSSLPKNLRSQPKSLSNSENRTLPVKSSSCVERTSIPVSPDKSLAFPAASQPIILDLEPAENILISKPNDADHFVSSLTNLSPKHCDEFVDTENVNENLCSSKKKASCCNTSHAITSQTGTQSSTPQDKIQGGPAQPVPCAKYTPNVPNSLGEKVISTESCPMFQRSSTVPNALKISSCPCGQSPLDAWRQSGTTQETVRNCLCISSHAVTSTPHSRTCHYLDKFPTSSFSVQNKAVEVPACSGKQQKHDENALGYSSESPVCSSCPNMCLPLSCNSVPGSHKNLAECTHCSTSSFNIKSGEVLHFNCIMCAICTSTNVPIYMGGIPCCKPQLLASRNCSAGHQITGCSNFGKPCLNMYALPSISPVCKGASLPNGPQVHAACQFHTSSGFSQSTSYLHKSEHATDSPLHCNVGPSSLPACMPSEVNHAFHPAIASHSSQNLTSGHFPRVCCEPSGNVSIRNMQMVHSTGNGRNHTHPMMSHTWKCGPHHSAGPSCHCSQPPSILKGEPAKVRRDASSSSSSDSLTYNSHGCPYTMMSCNAKIDHHEAGNCCQNTTASSPGLLPVQRGKRSCNTLAVTPQDDPHRKRGVGSQNTIKAAGRNLAKNPKYRSPSPP